MDVITNITYLVIHPLRQPVNLLHLSQSHEAEAVYLFGMSKFGSNSQHHFGNSRHDYQLVNSATTELTYG
jgi:hypothetical protein